MKCQNCGEDDVDVSAGEHLCWMCLCAYEDPEKHVVRCRACNFMDVGSRENIVEYYTCWCDDDDPDWEWIPVWEGDKADLVCTACGHPEEECDCA